MGVPFPGLVPGIFRWFFWTSFSPHLPGHPRKRTATCVARGQQHLTAHACHLGHPGSGTEWQEKLAERGTGEAGWHGRSPVEFSRLKSPSLVYLLDKHTLSTSGHQVTAQVHGDPPHRPSPLGVAAQGTHPQEGPPGSTPSTTTPPPSQASVPVGPGHCAVSLPAHLPPIPGRCVQPEGRT